MVTLSRLFLFLCFHLGFISEEDRNGSPSFCAINELNEELQTRLSLLRGQRENVPSTTGDQRQQSTEKDSPQTGSVESASLIGTPRRHKPAPSSVYIYITPESNPDEVCKWMKEKGFEPA